MTTENQADFRILGETGDFLAVDKPAGLLVHPTKPGGPRTLWDGLRDLLGYELANGGQVSLVNRLDRETSGIVLVAKNAAAAGAAGRAMQRQEIGKAYRALVFGWPEWDEATNDRSIIRRGEVEEAPVWLERMVHPQGSVACTHFKVAERRERSDGLRFSVIEAEPRTGRTHQIRVHLADLGFPVVGDKIYARGSDHYLRFIAGGWTEELAGALWLPRHALHCCFMSLGAHEWTSEWPPADLREVLASSSRAPASPR